MRLKTIVIDQLSKFRIINNLYSGIATIFMLHRVFPFEKNKLFPNENMKVSPEFLENFIIKLKKGGYEFINLDRLTEILANNEKVKKQIVFTLDDGYLDNFTHAYPVFKKLKVPFTIYLTSSFPEGKCILWWYILEDLLLENDFIELSTGTYSCKTQKEKSEVFIQIRELIINSTETETFIETLFSKYKIDWYQPCREKAMNWNQIVELSTDELVTIGGHTVNHLVLNSLEESLVINEIVKGNKIIEEKIKFSVNHFAYPFGSKTEITKRELDIVKGLNIKTATTTRNGNIFPKHKNYLNALPRIMLRENMELSEIGKIKRKRIVCS